MYKSTRYAILLADLLKKLGLKVEKERPDGYKHVDLSIDSAKLDIEVDGMHHLTNSDQILTDIQRSKYSRYDGYETVRVHNIDLKENAEDIAKALAGVAIKREDDLLTMAGETEKDEPIIG